MIGSGAMGLVISAQHMSLRERVAINLLRGDLSANPEVVARFEREARAAVKIRSEHVARVSDVGRLEDGSPFMVMEYLQGQDLGAHLRERGPLPLSDVADYLLQACEAIAHAHSLGIVHRDLKPENLFIRSAPTGRRASKCSTAPYVQPAAFQSPLPRDAWFCAQLDFPIGASVSTADFRLRINGSPLSNTEPLRNVDSTLSAPYQRLWVGVNYINDMQATDVTVHYDDIAVDSVDVPCN